MKFILGFLLGLVTMALLGWILMPSMMVHKMKSPYGAEETVQKISMNAEKQGWSIKKVADMQKSMKKQLGKDIPFTNVIKLGNAEYAHTLLADDKTRFVSAMMPHSISVYQSSNGDTYVSTMNMGLMGRLLGGKVNEIMSKVQADDDIILEFLQD